jgi:hypothetical protein
LYLIRSGLALLLLAPPGGSPAAESAGGSAGRFVIDLWQGE